MPRGKHSVPSISLVLLSEHHLPGNADSSASVAAMCDGNWTLQTVDEVHDTHHRLQQVHGNRTNVLHHDMQQQLHIILVLAVGGEQQGRGGGG